MKPLVADHLLFPEILWKLPQNVNQRRGSVFIVGETSGHSEPPIEAAEVCAVLGVRDVTLGLPETTADQLKSLITDVSIVALPETPSGSLSMLGKKDLLEQAASSDVCLFGLASTKQSETQQLLKSAIGDVSSASILVQDLLEGLTSEDFTARKQPTLLIVDAGILGKLLKRSGFQQAGDRPIVEHLYKEYLHILPNLAERWRTPVLLTTPEITIAPPDSQLIVAPSIRAEEFHRFLPLYCGLVTAFAAHQPAALFECAVTALTVFSELRQRNPGEAKKEALLAALPKLILDLEKSASG